eukprot:TRINITY_DN11484_c0_g2_i1.p1 TRINITY_DN11484_c0_g2~~TRINITY_DN11484_c0_g2_i1.p1  ORF type:complete len:535 (-),score=78.00 TRINITY_DN11484_c0_g2_i1:81-1685(-)
MAVAVVAPPEPPALSAACSLESEKDFVELTRVADGMRVLVARIEARLAAERHSLAKERAAFVAERVAAEAADLKRSEVGRGSDAETAVVAASPSGDGTDSSLVSKPASGKHQESRGPVSVAPSTRQVPGSTMSPPKCQESTAALSDSNAEDGIPPMPCRSSAEDSLPPMPGRRPPPKAIVPQAGKSTACIPETSNVASVSSAAPVVESEGRRVKAPPVQCHSPKSVSSTGCKANVIVKAPPSHIASGAKLNVLEADVAAPPPKKVPVVKAPPVKKSSAVAPPPQGGATPAREAVASSAIELNSLDASPAPDRASSAGTSATSTRDGFGAVPGCFAQCEGPPSKAPPRDSPHYRVMPPPPEAIALGAATSLLPPAAPQQSSPTSPPSPQPAAGPAAIDASGASESGASASSVRFKAYPGKKSQPASPPAHLMSPPRSPCAQEAATLHEQQTAPAKAGVAKAATGVAPPAKSRYKAPPAELQLAPRPKMGAAADAAGDAPTVAISDSAGASCSAAAAAPKSAVRVKAPPGATALKQ